VSRPPARDRILATSTSLFYRHGINNVGIDRVIDESGVAKATLYRHFASKDALVVAFLARINADWTAWLRSVVEKVDPPDRPLAVFDALESWFETPTFRGCPFIATAAEIRDPGHPIHQAAWSFKRELRDYLERLLVEAGSTRPRSLADQLLLLVDGAVVRAAMEGGVAPAHAAKAAARALLREVEP